MSNLSKASKAEAKLAEKIKLKLTEPTTSEMVELGITFDRILAKKNMSRKDWLRDNKIKNSDSQLSHLLNGRGKSAHLAKQVCEFVLDNS